MLYVLTYPSEELRLSVAVAMRRAREMSGLSAPDFAARLRALVGRRQPSAGTVTQYEAGIAMPLADVLFAAAVIAGCGVGDLV